MTQRNTELLQQTMQFIKDHPEQHDQATYWTECGTPSCFADWALYLAGIDQQQARKHYFGTGDYAALVLGLTVGERIKLFHPGNSVPMLELMVKDLINDDELRNWYNYHREAE